MKYSGIITTNSVLDEFVKYNQNLLEIAKRQEPLTSMQRRAFEVPASNNFLNNLVANKQKSQLSLIAEIKKSSPAEGDLNQKIDISKQAEIYENSGAAAISVLTQPYKFSGSLEDLHDVRNATQLPLLRKDFIIDPYQIAEAKLVGANAVLLIATILEPGLLKDLYYFAKSLKLDVLLEAYSEADLAKALNINPEIIGINARNLQNMQIDLNHTVKLMQQIPLVIIRVAESGIQNTMDVKKVQTAGADAILVGSTLMRSADPTKIIKDLLNA